MREMITDDGTGAFAASLDADSEGEEGRFYVWSENEIVAALGTDDAAFFGQFYDVSASGNWEGKVVLNRLSAFREPSETEAERLAGLRATLLREREKRVRPGWDDKVLADWNGLMIAALARAAFVFQRDDWLAMARQAYQFVVEKMTVDGRLVHCYRAGIAKAPATASDYANMIRAAVRLAERDDDPLGSCILMTRNPGARRWKSTIGLARGAAMPSPPTTRQTSSPGPRAPRTTPRRMPMPSW